MARPPLRGEPAVTVLRFRVTRREYHTLASYSAANSLTVSQAISEAVAEYLGDVADPDELPLVPFIATPAPTRR